MADTFYERMVDTANPENNFERFIESPPQVQPRVVVQPNNGPYLFGAAIALLIVFTLIGVFYVNGQKTKDSLQHDRQENYVEQHDGEGQHDGLTSQDRLSERGQQHEDVDWDVTVVGRGSNSGERYHLRYRRLASEKEFRNSEENEPRQTNRNQRAESQADSPHK